MIIFCPSCKRETQLTKCGECTTNWKCDFCNECCISKEGIPFQNEKTEDEINKWIEVQKKDNSKEIFKNEYEIVLPKKETEKKKPRSRQMTIFDFLK